MKDNPYKSTKLNPILTIILTLILTITKVLLVLTLHQILIFLIDVI